MSITENNIKSISFFNNNIKKLDIDVNKTIKILEDTHQLLYGIQIKIEKDKYLSMILTNYKEIIYNKIVTNNGNITINNDFYLTELKSLINQPHLDNQIERINWYYRSQFASLFNKLRLEYSSSQIIKEIQHESEKAFQELREDVNYNMTLKLENHDDNINFIINEKIKELKMEIANNNNYNNFYQVFIPILIYFILHIINIF